MSSIILSYIMIIYVSFYTQLEFQQRDMVQVVSCECLGQTYFTVFVVGLGEQYQLCLEFEENVFYCVCC